MRTRDPDLTTPTAGLTKPSYLDGADRGGTWDLVERARQLECHMAHLATTSNYNHAIGPMARSIPRS